MVRCEVILSLLFERQGRSLLLVAKLLKNEADTKSAVVNHLCLVTRTTAARCLSMETTLLPHTLLNFTNLIGTASL